MSMRTERVRPIVVTNDDVRRVRDGVALHPLIDRPLTSLAAAFRRDSRGTQGCVKKGDKGLDCGVVARRVESNAMGARDEVPVPRADEGVA